MRTPSAAPFRLSPRTRLTIALVGAGLWASGGLWLIVHYFFRRAGPWGPEPHLLEPWSLGLHGLFAFAALWLIGLLCGLHIVRAWRSGRRRWSGGILLAWLVALTLTGYLLIYAGDDGAWGLVSPSHWIAGLALPVLYGVHRLFRLLRRGS